MAAHTDG